MRLTKGKFFLVLVCLAGQTFHSPVGQVLQQSSGEAQEGADGVKALASILLTRDPSAAFSAASLGASQPGKDSNPRLTRARIDGEPNMQTKSSWEPPFWAPGLSKRAFERIPGPVNKPWIPSWIDEEEKAEQRLSEAMKWKPEYIPEPWIGPLADDEERARLEDEHERVLAAQSAAPCPSWVTDWMREAGKENVPTTVGEVQGYGKILPGQRIIFKPPPWAEGLNKRQFERIPEPSPQPWIPHWLDEEEQSEKRVNEAEKWRPEYIPEPWLGAYWKDEDREEAKRGHERTVKAQRSGPPPEWVIEWLKEGGKPIPNNVGEIMDLPSPNPPPDWRPSWCEDDDWLGDMAPEITYPTEPVFFDGTPAPAAAGETAAPAPVPVPPGPPGTSRYINVQGLPNVGDELEFKVTDMVKEGDKLKITFDGPFKFTADGDLAAD